MKARLPKGMGGGPTNMQGMLKQAQKMQEDMAALQEDLDAREYDIKAGGGVVTVKINGKLEIKNIELDPDIVDPDDVETLQDIINEHGNDYFHHVEESVLLETDVDNYVIATGGSAIFNVLKKLLSKNLELKVLNL